MKDWKSKLKEAKELFDMDIINQSEFEDIKKQALHEMGLTKNKKNKIISQYTKK